MSYFSDFLVLLASQQVEPSPGFIVGPIARVFGFAIDVLFNLVYAINPAHSLGFTIILMTIIFRFLMLPLMLKSMKSMNKLREIQPELKKIQDKYGNSKDPEIMKKANAERSAVMAKHGANPLSGCLPMLIQMPLFIGLTFIMRQAFLYITRLQDIYHRLAQALIDVPGLIGGSGADALPLTRLANPLIPNRMHESGTYAFRLITQHGYTVEMAMERAGEFIALGIPADLARVLNRFTPENWAYLFAYIPEASLPYIQELQARLIEIETFFGLSTVVPGGLRWPGILIPIICFITMFISTWLMQLRMHDPNATDQQKMQQKIMLAVMPIMMSVFTVQFPAGVGIFWITGQVFAVVQELVMNRKAKIPFRLPFVKSS